jgi:hypothetical protein
MAGVSGVGNWDEGGTSRIALHVAGGALVAGLGGGSVASAAQGAAGAGVAAWAAGDLNRLANGTRDALGGGDAAQMAGNVLANVVAGAGGFLIGGTTGAFSASNADLYNRSTGNGDGQGSTANSAVDSVKNAAAGAWNGLVSLGEVIANIPNGGPFASPGDPGYISANGLKLPYTPGDQVGPGVEFFTAALATRGAGKGAAAEAEAEAATAGKAVTSGGTANAATYPDMKNQLADENLAGIAAQDPRLAAAVNGSGTKNINFNIGQGTAAEADQLGKAWVGDGAKMTSDGTGWVSADGTRVYRAPTVKPNVPVEFSPTGIQANFQQLENGKVISNGHLNVTK